MARSKNRKPKLTLRNNRDNSHNRKSGVLHEEVEINEDKNKEKNEHSGRVTIHNIPDHKAGTHSNC